VTLPIFIISPLKWDKDYRGKNILKGKNAEFWVEVKDKLCGLEWI
jgi:hypothetical protein